MPTTQLTFASPTATRRGKQGHATAFRTTAPVMLLIDAIAKEENQTIAQIAYWSAGRIDAVLHLTSTDLLNNKVRYRIENSKTSSYHEVHQTGSLQAYLETVALSIGPLFPAKRKGKAKPTAFYKFRKENGKTKRVKVGEKTRHVRSVSSFDYALNKAVERIILAPPDSYYDQMIETMPEVKASGRRSFHGVSSHSFRRSMAMYLFYTLDWDAALCMGVTGHKSLDAFYQYIDYKTDGLAAMMQAI